MNIEVVFETVESSCLSNSSGSKFHVAVPACEKAHIAYTVVLDIK